MEIYLIYSRFSALLYFIGFRTIQEISGHLLTRIKIISQQPIVKHGQYKLAHQNFNIEIEIEHKRNVKEI